MGGAFGSNRRFEEQYHCYSVAYADKSHLEVRKMMMSYVYFWITKILGVSYIDVSLDMISISVPLPVLVNT